MRNITSFPGNNSSFPGNNISFPRNNNSFNIILFLRNIISLSQNNNSLRCNFISFTRNITSFPQNSNSFPQNNNSFHRNIALFPWNIISFPRNNKIIIRSLEIVFYLLKGWPLTCARYDALGTLLRISQQSSWNQNLSGVRCQYVSLQSVGHPWSVSQSLMNPFQWFLLNFGCLLPWTIFHFQWSDFCFNFLKTSGFSDFHDFFPFSVTWYPLWAKIAERYSELVLNFLLSAHHKSTVLDLWNFELHIFHDLFPEISRSLLQHIGKPKLQLPRKGAIVERNVVKFNRLGKYLMYMYTGHFKYFRSVWRQSVHFRVSTTLYH